MGIVDRITSNTELKLAQIERELGFGNGTISRWDKSSPSFDKIIAVAELIDVSIDYLAGRKETKKEPTVIPYSGNERVDSIANRILKTDLTEDDLNLIEFILDKYKK